MTMKTIAILFAVVLCAGSAQSQTFITYGNSTISREEFLKAYNKNKVEVPDKEKALREYADLYANFKLKVKAAEELRLDTLPQIQFDIRNFREQIIENYLSNDKGIERLTGEALKRAQKDLHIIHFSAPAFANATPVDTARAYKAIMDLYQRMKDGKKEAAALTENAAANGSVVKQADFGYVTVFTLPYEYENIIYNLKDGELSQPYRSKNAWHIFKLAGERPSAGRWKIAQILVAVSPDADEAAITAARNKADNVYGKLKDGESFMEIAKTSSDDKLTYLNGGELQEFGTGTYTSNFEDEVLKLHTDGQLSQPFRTALGFHVIKRMGFAPTPSNDKDAAYLFDLKQKVLRDARVNAEKEQFSKEIVSRVGVKKITKVKDADLYRFADSLLMNPALEQVNAWPISDKDILKVNKETLKGSDWLSFVRAYYNNNPETGGKPNKQLWSKFEEAAALNYYKANLETYNPDFKFQMQEFREGNMLFEIMEKKVWGKAIDDSVGLRKYYDAHQQDFKWAASTDVLIFNATTAKVADEAMNALKKGKNWRTVAEELGTSLQADSGRYELTQITGANTATTPTRGTYTATVTNIDGSATFVKYVNVYPANQQRSFEEARGLVINEYQQQLEQEWLADLKKKYPVRINEGMIKQML